MLSGREWKYRVSQNKGFNALDIKEIDSSWFNISQTRKEDFKRQRLVRISSVKRYISLFLQKFCGHRWLETGKQTSFEGSHWNSFFCKSILFYANEREETAVVQGCSFFNKIAELRPATLLKKTLAQVFSCEFCEISKTSFFIEHLWWLLLKKSILSKDDCFDTEMKKMGYPWKKWVSTWVLSMYCKWNGITFNISQAERTLAVFCSLKYSMRLLVSE